MNQSNNSASVLPPFRCFYSCFSDSVLAQSILLIFLFLQTPTLNSLKLWTEQPNYQQKLLPSTADANYASTVLSAGYIDFKNSQFTKRISSFIDDIDASNKGGRWGVFTCGGCGGRPRGPCACARPSCSRSGGGAWSPGARRPSSPPAGTAGRWTPPPRSRPPRSAHCTPWSPRPPPSASAGAPRGPPTAAAATSSRRTGPGEAAAARSAVTWWLERQPWPWPSIGLA